MVAEAERAVGQSNGRFPRPLTSHEREIIEAVLPDDHPGYRKYREMLGDLVVLGEGRRGKGNFILGRAGVVPDTTAPLPPVVAHGAIVTRDGEILVSIREEVDGQIDVEVTGEIHSRGEVRRWSISSWRPGQPSPRSGSPVREVVVSEGLVLAICVADRRMWIHESASGLNHLIPVTGFHEALMKVRKVRDPQIALRPGGFFSSGSDYSSEDLRSAFLIYNSTFPKVRTPEVSGPAASSFLQRFLSHVLRKR